MTPTALAETILRDVKRHYDANAERVMLETEVLAALTATMDPAIAERARVHLLHLRDDLGPWSKQSADLITALLTANAALRAERDELEGVIKYRREPSIVGAVGRALRMKSEAEARAEAAEAKVEGLTGLLCLADEALMESHGCFPIDRTNERQIFLNDACTAIRKVTGDDYAERKRRARAALSTTEASHE